MRDIRVLHVDDDPNFAELTRKFLEQESEQFQVVTETHASNALDRLTESDEKIDCILSDYALPDINGIEFLEQVRTEYPELPFILFTGKGSESVAGDALSCGATDYLQKRGGAEQYALLANRIQNAVTQYRDRQERELSERYRLKLYEITSDPALEFEEKVERLLEPGCERLGVENGHVVHIDKQTGRHTVRMAAGSDFVQPDTVTELEDAYCRKTISSKDILAVHNAPEEGWEDDPGYKEWGIACYIGSRIEVSDELYGTLCFVNQRPRSQEFTQAERSFVDLLTLWLTHMFERREYERDVRNHQLVSDTIADGIYVLDENRECTMANDALSELTGYSRDELLEVPISRIFDDEDATEWRTTGSVETEIRTADGDTVSCRVREIECPRTDKTETTMGVVRESPESGDSGLRFELPAGDERK